MLPARQRTAIIPNGSSDQADDSTIENRSKPVFVTLIEREQYHTLNIGGISFVTTVIKKAYKIRLFEYRAHLVLF